MYLYVSRTSLGSGRVWTNLWASDLEKYAEDVYYRLFNDEGHWLFVFVKSPNYTSPAYQWCDMAGDKTNRIVTDEVFSEFKNEVGSSINTFSSDSIARGMIRATKAATSASSGRGGAIFFGFLCIAVALGSVCWLAIKIRQVKKLGEELGVATTNTGIAQPTDSNISDSIVTIKEDPKPTTVVRKIRCHSCGAEYDSNLDYCPNCGNDNLEIDGFNK